ncbi:wD repeat domain [Linnemannia zychae]|nr:wD repeat domain [Linnemannia zychae]
MKGHTDVVKSVAFSLCGKQLASAGSDKTVRLWSSETGECMFVLKGHIGVVASVMYCADGKRLISGSGDDGTIRLWSPETGELVSCHNITQSKKNSRLAFSADGQWVAVSLEGKVQITNAVTAEPGPVLNNSGNVNHIAFSSNGQWIVTCNHDGGSTVRLWDSNGNPISNFSGHAQWIYTCIFSPDCSQIASGDGEGYVRLWEVDTSRVILYSGRTTSPVRTVTFSPDGQSILSGSHGQGVKQWDSLTGVSEPLLLKLPVDGVSLWKSLLARASPQPRVADNIWSLKLSPCGSQLATGHSDKTIRLWNRQTNAVERTLLGHTNDVTQLAYSPCGRWIVSADVDGARLWDLHTNEHPGLIAQTDLLSYFMYFISFTPTGQIVLKSNEKALRLHDPHAHDPCAVLKEISIPSPIRSLDCSPDGLNVAIGTEEGTIYLWDFQSDKPRVELNGHSASVRSVAYSPCGKWMLSGSEDKTIRIWRLGTSIGSSWSCIAVVSGCSNTILSLAWNPVKALEFVTGCEDNSIRLWRITSNDDTDEKDVFVQMLWGNDIGLLCTMGLTFKDAIDLSPINQRLLVQRGAKDDLP